MSISSQLPQIVTAGRSGALQALALQAGQTLEATVIGPAPNGGTQVKIAGQMLNLILPTLAKAGETLKMEVQGTGAQLRLALHPAVVPTTTGLPAAQPAPAQSVTLPLPHTQAPAQVPLSNAPPPLTTSVSVPPPPAALATPSPATSSAPPVPVTQQLPGATTAPLPLPASSSPQPQMAVMPQSPPTATVSPSTLAAGSPQPMPVQPAPTGWAPQATPQVYSQTAQVLPAPGGTVPSPLLIGQAPQSAAPLAQPAPVGQHTAPLPTTPQAALAQMVQASVPRQGPITSLTSALTSIAGKVALPEPVARAAQQVLAGQLAAPNGKIEATTLQRAVQTSGVFQEATLAQGGSSPAQSDMKSALLVLRQTLTTWLGPQAPIAPPTHVAPPMRGSAPRAKTADAPPIDPATAPDEVGKQLLERTESALSRLRLHQHASLPDAAARTGGDWSMDLPMLVGQHQTLLQIQIHRDQQGSSDDSGERGWQMRFALNLPDLGEVGAQVSLRGTATGIMLWATESATSEALEAGLGELREALVSAGLKPGAVIVRRGEPPVSAAAPSGHFLDART
ncbi:flagellar hook-length control protein FliK [Devosia lacusdianchii]|uniref:flagellar hook-length control protein FliK n=1 Tax=Devosia lacusdianchii TaxID=2917991 RepID=UPI001F06EA6A|nr:flagellar hook-length control protein FliK [Devosia sp. JXJ CY 41]